jgi:long-chain acyl-CoA synthetase
VTCWWHDDATIARFVCDLVATELSSLRPSGFAAPPAPWDASLHLSSELGIDSLERVALASALTEAIHLHEVGIEDRLLISRTIGEWIAVAREGLEAWHATLTFRTSGSAGDPKRCEHALSHLWQEVDTLAPLFQDRRRVLSAVRSHHIYGFLFTALSPSCALGISWWVIPSSGAPSRALAIRSRAASSASPRLRPVPQMLHVT